MRSASDGGRVLARSTRIAASTMSETGWGGSLDGQVVLEGLPIGDESPVDEERPAPTGPWPRPRVGRTRLMRLVMRWVSELSILSALTCVKVPFFTAAASSP